MITNILQHSITQMIIIFILYFLVLVLIGLDLWAGVRKAKARNEFTSSTGYKRTVSKIAQYFNALFALTVIDIVQMLSCGLINHYGGYSLLLLPFITILGAIFIGAIEVKSILEKNDEKEQAKMQEAFTLLCTIAKNHDLQDIIKGANEYLSSKKVDTEE